MSFLSYALSDRYRVYFVMEALRVDLTSVGHGLRLGELSPTRTSFTLVYRSELMFLFLFLLLFHNVLQITLLSHVYP